MKFTTPLSGLILLAMTATAVPTTTETAFICPQDTFGGCCDSFNEYGGGVDCMSLLGKTATSSQ